MSAVVESRASATGLADHINKKIRIRGIVQGVGFRPTVYRLALECQLLGEVSNDSRGVLLFLSGTSARIDTFFSRLYEEVPPLAKIDSVESEIIDELWQYDGFSISGSGHGLAQTEIAADAASCGACLSEVWDPTQHRYLYPFTNCTHCGPRLSIIRGIPYDRISTTMAGFQFCAECQREYLDPTDRRFHAQPVACHQCGPRLFVRESGRAWLSQSAEFSNISGVDSSREILELINTALIAGKILAIKGLGGFHLCCDASNAESVSLLRQRKQRYAKPFALMCKDVESVRRYCVTSFLEEKTLKGPAAPIVLLQQKALIEHALPILAADIAPGSALVGVMLPYTPLHSLIARAFGRPLVMTSGNLAGEPQIIDNTEALEKLSGIADAIVYHNRDIANRIDDSVVRCVSNKVRLMRRSRGYAPHSIPMPEGFDLAENVLAYGAELKSTFCLLKKGSAILSQHQGDLEDLKTFDDYEKNIALYQALFEFEPQALAYDKHPEYLSRKLARATIEKSRVDGSGILGIEVQHHHAHIASVLVENKIPLTHAPVLGIALDGLGFGDGNSLWGGEFLLAKYESYVRLASLLPVAMPGASQAIKQPWRNTLAHILSAMSWATFSEKYSETELGVLFRTMPTHNIKYMIDNGLNSPLVSSAGRLFDAVAGALSLSAEGVKFEGQAAMELENLVDVGAVLSGSVRQPYPFRVLPVNSSSADSMLPFFHIDARGIWSPLLDDLCKGVSRALIATRFHAGLISGLLELVDILQEHYHFAEVAVSGGCVQNATLLQGLEQGLSKRGLCCLSNSLVPANDGGIALGQVAVAAAKIIRTHAARK